MTSAQQRAAPHRQIWQIANDVRGAAGTLNNRSSAHCFAALSAKPFPSTSRPVTRAFDPCGGLNGSALGRARDSYRKRPPPPIHGIFG